MSITTAMNVARSGLQLQETQIGVKSQNLAAQGVTAYKRQYLVAYDLPYQEIDAAGANTSSSGTMNNIGMQTGLGVKAAGIYRSFQNGDLIKTENELDLAIQNDGYFQVSMPDGSFSYTRAGTLSVNAQGQITTIYGHPIVPTITIPNTALSVSINGDGQVSIDNGTGTEVVLAQIQLSTFINPSGLKAMGDNLFTETAASGSPDTGVPNTNRRGSIMQGWLESSNVNPVEELTEMIKIQRAYEMLTKVLNAGDSMMQTANSVGRS